MANFFEIVTQVFRTTLEILLTNTINPIAAIIAFFILNKLLLNNIKKEPLKSI